MKFSKYQGAGNDFVMLDNRDGQYNNISVQTISAMCDRRFGIGADGVLLLTPHDLLSFRMVYFNSDGSRASFCGNGARCISAFACALGLVPQNQKFSFEADDGFHSATCTDGWVDLKMIDVQSVEPLLGGAFLNTGVPHFVIEVENLPALDIMQAAPHFRHHERFAPSGTNVDFIAIDAPDSISVRTFERGVEGETLACGTGIVASAIVASLQTGRSSFNVHARGGNLTVKFQKNSDNSYSNVYLGGPAIRVFDGEWYDSVH